MLAEPLTKTRIDRSKTMLHPSFLKDYELTERPGAGNQALTALWRTAARVPREAEQIFVIGYSLPPPDSAALTLLPTNCEAERVTIVNRSVQANHRLRILLSRVLGPATTLDDWLGAFPDCA
jgi:hypothetical protein